MEILPTGRKNLILNGRLYMVCFQISILIPQTEEIEYGTCIHE